jgi:hypothetical protein
MEEIQSLFFWKIPEYLTYIHIDVETLSSSALRTGLGSFLVQSVINSLLRLSLFKYL